MKNEEKDFAVVCVVGQPGSGKGYSGKVSCGKKHFWHISTGNIIREEMRTRNIPTDRENMRIFSQKNAQSKWQ